MYELCLDALLYYIVQEALPLLLCGRVRWRRCGVLSGRNGEGWNSHVGVLQTRRLLVEWIIGFGGKAVGVVRM